MIPALSVIIPTIIVVFCGMTKLCTNSKSSPKCSKILFKCGFYSGLIALAGAFFIGWIIMLIASLSFASGYSIEALCNPLFHDSKMRLFSTVPLFQFNIQIPIDRKNFTTNIGNIIKQCKNNETILSVLEIERLINVDGIMKKMDIEGRRNRAIDVIKNINLKQHFPEQFFNQLMEDSEWLEKMNTELNNFIISDDIAVLNESLHDNFNYMFDNISNLIKIITDTTNTTKQVIDEYLYSNEMINESTQIIVRETNNTITIIRKYISESTNYLRKNSYGCRPFYDIWHNTGLAMRQKIGQPIQALWLTTALLALSFIPVIILTKLIMKYLTKMNRKYDFKEKILTL
ncbi:hypothetical protein LOAG_13293 [Loa loa]|uniref:Prominin n=1 Tax=Loa loa TaxID=7209 RepID=A0A1S0TJQ4_LOALO|nr:hypothetical protein LOAG_13293 [Loa loa]EFO15219.1 hypothetical protein LOAG_13293 [Loa loa]